MIGHLPRECGMLRLVVVHFSAQEFSGTNLIYYQIIIIHCSFLLWDSCRELAVEILGELIEVQASLQERGRWEGEYFSS